MNWKASSVRLVCFSVLVASVRIGIADEPIASIPSEKFHQLHAMIKPQPGESPWREINWLTNITEARRRAVAEDKPLIIFTAADGSPIGRT